MKKHRDRSKVRKNQQRRRAFNAAAVLKRIGKKALAHLAKLSAPPTAEESEALSKDAIRRLNKYRRRHGQQLHPLG